MENTVNLFLYEHGAFSKSLKFNTVVFFVTVLVIFTFFFRKTFAFVIILLLFAMYMSELYVKTNNTKISDFNKVTLSKLNEIQNRINIAVLKKLDTIEKPVKNKVQLQSLQKSQMKKLHNDATMIHFLHSVLPLADYNEQLFVTWIKGINNILDIKSKIEIYYAANQTYPENIAEMFEICLHLKTNTINNAHDFVYSVPNLKYVDQILERYYLLISRNVDTIHQYYLHSIKINGINNKSKFIAYNTTKPYDKLTNHPIINKKGESQLISLYY
jgi:hypothetical protein